MIKKMSFKEYRESPELNISSLVNIEKSPAHFQWCKANPKDSKSLIKGRAIHQLILEPELFNDVYAIEPDKSKFKYVTVDDLKPLCEKYGQKKSGKKEEILKSLRPLLSSDEINQVYDFEMSCFSQESSSMEILSAKEYLEAKMVADNILKSPKIQNMLSKGQSEIAIFQTIDDVQMKARLDFLDSKPRFSIDIKSCRDCDPVAFGRDFINFGYDVKFGYYQKMIELEFGVQVPMLALACETTDECDYVPYNIPQQVLDIGYSKFLKLLKTWKECTAKNEWPAMSKEIQEPIFPEWYFRNEGIL